eukprot:8494446-Alexandrium_andersonii.AAC.1
MARNVGTTVTERMRAARIACEMLGNQKASFRTKVACVAAKVLPMALYGSQAVPLAKRELHALGSSILAALFPGASRSRARALAQQ